MKIDLSNGYSREVQKLILARACVDPTFEHLRRYLHPDFFDDPLRETVQFVHQHHTNYGKPPSYDLIHAKTQTDFRALTPPNDAEMAWLRDELPKFAKYRAVENVILDGIDNLRAGQVSAIVSALEQAMEIQSVKERFAASTIDSFDPHDMPKWIFPELLLEQQVGMVYAKPGSYKSFWAISMASLLANGMMWNGHILQKRNVAIVAGEGGSMIDVRRVGWLQSHHKPIKHDGVYTVKQAINLLDPDDVSQFIASMRRLDLGWIILDTLSTMIAGLDENSPEVMSAAIEACKRIAKELDCAVLVVHHPGKQEGNGARGHSSGLGNVDTMLHLARTGNEMCLTVEKQKDGRDGLKFYFQAIGHKLGFFDDAGRERDTLVVIEKPAATTPAISQTESDLLTFASVMTPDMEVSQKSLFELAKTQAGFPRKYETALARIERALPWLQTARVLSAEHGWVQFSRHEGKRGAKLIRMTQLAQVQNEADMPS